MKNKCIILIKCIYFNYLVKYFSVLVHLVMCNMLLTAFILVSFASSPVICRVSTSEDSLCRENLKQCLDGSCISRDSDCNEVLSHHNSSDETFPPIPQGQSLNTRHRRQASGSSNQCVLPPYPEHGTYIVSNVPNTTPGQSFESFVLKVVCRRGFGFLGSAEGIDTFGSEQIYCINGRWFQNMPQCVRFCKLKPHHSVRYMCQVSEVSFTTCKRYLPPGTAVNPVCNSPIYTSTKVQPLMKCVAGYWDYIAECQAECGQVTSEGEQLVIGGELAKRGELPWHVGIYEKKSIPFKQICGGSIVSNNVVISAAHCFWHDVSGKRLASDYAVAAGKLYRAWDSNDDVDVQTSDVLEIKIPELFFGASTNFQEDIAVMILKTPFEYRTYVRPVCLHYNVNFERRQLQHGKYGKVAGWGLTAANGWESHLLKVVEFPFISSALCLRTVPKQFREYITVDKFCAGYTNGTSVCRGDSGGGLSFAAKTDLDIERYYLRGIVSTAPSTDDLCNANTYSTFTKITKHEELIKDVQARANKQCPPHLFQCDDGDCVYQGADCNGKKDCKDGSDEADALCIPGFEAPPEAPKTSCVLPPIPSHGIYKVPNDPNARPGQFFDTFVLEMTCDQGFDMVDSKGFEKNGTQQFKCTNGVWDQEMPKCLKKCGRVTPLTALPMFGGGVVRELPWHVGVYAKAQSYLHICGGTLVSQNVVLSAATCFDEDKRIVPSKYGVAAGKLYGRWDDSNDSGVQKSAVKEVKISTLSKTAKSKMAALILETPFVYTPYVRAACLNLNPNLDVQDMLGKTATWPFEADEVPPYKLRTMVALELSNNPDTCGNFLKAAQGINVCAAYTKDPRVFAVFAGSGLVYPHSDAGMKYFYLSGVMSNLLVCGNGCVDSDYNYHIVTKLSDYREFILNAIN